ncbi:hypothetical protein Mapa_017570 [Marchantia paleacea]|nr:hypothetical protein Mapa_017570 [Marchantia paleacea]
MAPAVYACVQGGKESVWYMLEDRRVLMVLDDVNSVDEINTFLTLNWCAQGSRLIITSCIRSQAMMSLFLIHEVPILSTAESKKLFLAHLHMVEEVPKGLIHKVIKKCDGLPLTLTVIGSYLCKEKNKSVWDGAVKKLERAESVEGTQTDILWKKLQVSFDALEATEQMIFVDLAVFDQCDPEHVKYNLALFKCAWENGLAQGVVDNCLRNLIDRSFLIDPDYTCIGPPTRESKSLLLFTSNSVIWEREFPGHGMKMLSSAGESGNLLM